MLFRDSLHKVVNLVAAYISLENCRACKRLVNNRDPLCPPQSVCTQCWMQLLKGKGKLPAQIDGMNLHAVGVHSGLLRKLIIKLKQTEDPLLANDLSCLLPLHDKGQQLAELIIPMPLHKKRRGQRGFNQSELLARSLSGSLSVPLSIKALSRIKDTRSQRGLRRDQRWENMQTAFAACSQLVEDKTVMLVDDVYTSGATMHSASKSLLDAGAANVVEICIAVAPLHHGELR